MDKKLEFYGTLGPACQEEDILCALLEEGMTGVRLNLSHTDLEACTPWLDHLQKASLHSGVRCRLLIDLKGPELRIGKLDAPFPLEEGSCVRVGEGGIPLPSIAVAALYPGRELLLDDGAILLRSKSQNGTYAFCIVERGGLLYSRKSAALPNAGLHPPTLTKSDLHNLSLASTHGVNDVMLPFVRSAKDLDTLRNALTQQNSNHIRIFAKLENMAGVDVLPDLLPGADQIVIARGDLGNDMPLWELPGIQKHISEVCRIQDKPFMVVTQMLHSMQQSAVPTRAEVSDIYNAVLDGASSLMLTGETAIGKYPVAAMRYLVRTAQSALSSL